MNKYIVADCCSTVVISLGGLRKGKKKKSSERKNKLNTMWKKQSAGQFHRRPRLSGDSLFLKYVCGPCVKLTQ